MFNFFKKNDSKTEPIEQKEESSKSFWNFSFEYDAKNRGKNNVKRSNKRRF